jgi:hypothetical protein
MNKYIYDISSIRVNQLLCCVSLKIYNKFANYFCEPKFSGNTKDPSSAWGCDTSGNIPLCGVALRRTCRCAEFHRVKNADLRHPSAMCQTEPVSQTFRGICLLTCLGDMSIIRNLSERVVRRLIHFVGSFRQLIPFVGWYPSSADTFRRPPSLADTFVG